MNKWKGRVAVVTGASAGIGAAICRLLAADGMKVVGCARRVEKIQELAKEFPSIYAYKVRIQLFFCLVLVSEKSTGHLWLGRGVEVFGEEMVLVLYRNRGRFINSLSFVAVAKDDKNKGRFSVSVFFFF